MTAESAEHPGILRVCFFIPSFADGGAQRQCIYLLNEIAKRPDVAVTLVRTASGIHDSLLNEEGIDVRNVRVRSNYDPRVIWRVARVLRDTRADVIFSWLQASDVPSYFIRALSPHTAWVLAERNSYYRNEIRFRVRARLGRSADGIISNSPAGDRYWAALRPRGQRFVIGNIVNSPPAPVPREELGLIGSEPLVVAMGRLEAQKDPQAVVRALLRLIDRRPEVRALVVGDGSMRAELEAMVSAAGRADAIRFLGFRHDGDQILAAADAFVTLSKYEGMPNVLVEAVTSGVPVVASRIPEHVDVLGTGYPYYADDPSDADATSAVLERAIGESETRLALAEAQERLVARTPTKVADEYMAAFRSVAAERQRQRRTSGR